MNIIIVSPHPDDAELGCGGFIAKAVEKGHKVKILVINNAGDLKMRHSGEVVPFEKRALEQLEAGEILGVESVDYLTGEVPLRRYFASKFDHVPLGETVGYLDEYFSKVFDGKVDLVMMPYPSCNQDHDYVFKAVMACMRPVARPGVSVMCYEQTLDYYSDPAPTGYTNYVPITEAHLKRKIQALEAHVSQVAGRQENCILGGEAVYTLAKHRGYQCGAEYAECFKPIRVVL